MVEDTAATASGSRPEYRIALFGVDPECQRALEIVSRHARHNPFEFRLAASRQAEAFDIAIVDMSVAGGPEVASTLDHLLDGRPMLRLGRRSDPRRVCDDVVHKNFSRQVLSVLNRVVCEWQGIATKPEELSEYTRPAGAAAGSALASGSVFAPVSSDAPPLLSETIAVGRLPGQEAAPSMAAFSSGLAFRTEERSQQPCALIVDDSPTVRRQLSVALSQMGIRSEAVDTAEAAMSKLLSRPFDLVFADIVMPGRDGYQFTRDIRRHRSLKKVPIIILTSRSSPFDLVRAALAGCNSYLVKPVSLQSLRDTVKRQLGRSTHERNAMPAMVHMT